jgi:hypothetical protein
MAFVAFPRLLNGAETIDLACHLASRNGVRFPRGAALPNPRYVSDGAQTVEWSHGEVTISLTKERGYGCDHGEYPVSLLVVLTGLHPTATLRMSAGEDVWSTEPDRFQCDGISIWHAESATAEDAWRSAIETWFATSLTGEVP